MRSWLARLRPTLDSTQRGAGRWSWRLGLFVLLALALAVYAAFVQSTGPALVVEGGPTVPTIDVSEFSTGVPVGQEFVPLSDHLNAITVAFRAEHPVDAEIRCTLLSVSDAGQVPIYSWVDTIQLEGRTSHTFRFPSVVRSAGRRFHFELRLPRPLEGVSLEARTDDVLRPGFLVIDGLERWGDLVFRTTSATLAGVLSTTPRSVPRALRQPAVLLALLLVHACALAFFWVGLVGPREFGWAVTVGEVSTMLKRPAVLVGIVTLAVGALALRYRTVEPPTTTIDLIDRFDDATKTSDLTLERAFEVAELAIDDRSRRVIGAHPISRLSWRVRIPEDAWLRTSVALKPGAWGLEGDGVLFRVGVARGETIEVLASRYVDPRGDPADRAWIPMRVDLSSFAGQELDVMLGTDPGLDGSVDSRFDWAVWAEPQIVVQP